MVWIEGGELRVDGVAPSTLNPKPESQSLQPETHTRHALSLSFVSLSEEHVYAFAFDGSGFRVWGLQ